mmetsp:Transcript_1414/g.3462  ORF Transcript_1414/g.3462 Transcript_1414/m.3462 type:complete len:204 (-) Transcript_1414:494-1105(-)
MVLLGVRGQRLARRVALLLLDDPVGQRDRRLRRRALPLRAHHLGPPARRVAPHALQRGRGGCRPAALRAAADPLAGHEAARHGQPHALRLSQSHAGGPAPWLLGAAQRKRAAAHQPAARVQEELLAGHPHAHRPGRAQEVPHARPGGPHADAQRGRLRLLHARLVRRSAAAAALRHRLAALHHGHAGVAHPARGADRRAERRA